MKQKRKSPIMWIGKQTTVIENANFQRNKMYLNGKLNFFRLFFFILVTIISADSDYLLQ